MLRDFKVKRSKFSAEEEAATDAVIEAIFGNKILDFEEYDFNETPMNNTVTARNNMLLDLISARLSDVETFKARYNPGGFTGASRAARILRELLFGEIKSVFNSGRVNWGELDNRADNRDSDPEPNYDTSDPMTIITYNQQNQVAGKLIGIFANQNANYAFSSLMKSFKTKKPISFAGKSYSDLLHPPIGVNVKRNVSEFLAASVDAVKDPVLNFLNLNTITADAGAVLARLGYSTLDIGLLFNQPIIKEICEYAFNNNTTPQIAILDILNSYKKEGEKIDDPNPQEAFSIDMLARNIVNEREVGKDKLMLNNSIRINQLQVLKLFQEILSVSDDVSQFVTSTKFTASNSISSTFGGLFSQQMKVRNYIKKFSKNARGETALNVVMEITDTIDKPINNISRKIFSSPLEYLESLIANPFAYEQAMYDMNRDALELLMKYFPYTTEIYSRTRDFMAGLTTSEYLDGTTIDSIHNDILVYMLSTLPASPFNGSLDKTDENGNKTGETQRDYYLKSFPKILFNLLENNPSYKERFSIFEYMQFPTDEKTKDVSIVVQGIGGLSSTQKEGIKESWEQLSKENPNLARDLFLYNFHKLGFSFSPLSFMNLAPTSVKEMIVVGKKWQEGKNGEEGKWVDKTYIDFLNEVKDGKIKFNTQDFAKQYILNHLDNYRFVYKIGKKGKSYNIVSKEAFKGSVAKNSFTLDLNSLRDKEDSKYFILKSDQNGTFFKPVIVIGEVTYMCDNPGMFNFSATGQMTYRRVNKLGTTNSSVQYNSGNADLTTDSNTPKGTEDSSTPATFDRKSIIDEILEGLVSTGSIIQEDAAKVKVEVLDKESDNGLKEYVNQIRELIRQEGLTDNTGEKSC